MASITPNTTPNSPLNRTPGGSPIPFAASSKTAPNSPLNRTPNRSPILFPQEETALKTLNVAMLVIRICALSADAKKTVDRLLPQGSSLKDILIQIADHQASDRQVESLINAMNQASSIFAYQQNRLQPHLDSAMNELRLEPKQA
jgi:hypothetical protein